MTSRRNAFVVLALAAAFLLQHLLYLPRSLEDIDSVNFALALHEFAVAKHQPHPPGYPVFVALGRAARAVAPAAWPGLSPSALDARALALCGTILGAFGTLSLWWFLHRLDGDARRALAATALTVLSPLVWFEASRPMSDVSGLAFTWTAQALIVAWMAGARRSPSGRRVGDESHQTAPATGEAPRALLLVAAAFLSALAGGVRSQTIVLTLPLLLLALVWAPREWVLRRRVALAYAAGLAIWLVPLLVSSGGPIHFVTALTDQARDDFLGVPMLATTLTPRALASALVQTFVYPWAFPATAGVVLGMAAVGAVIVLRRDRTVALVLATAVLPYAIFHLAFQETVTTRYALPLVAPVAYLAVRGIDRIARRLTLVTVAVMAVAGLATAVPAQRAYARDGSPVFRAMNDFESARIAPPRRVLGMHAGITRALRHRALRDQAVVLEPGVQQIEQTLLRDDAAPVWFLANPKRTDLARVDAMGRRLRRAYRWGFDTRTFLGGVRPSGVDLVEIARPGWVAGDGWSLTPEMAGQATRSGGPTRVPVVVHVRSRAEGVAVLLGGRRLDDARGTQVDLSLRIGNRLLDRWTVASGPEPFLREWTLPPGALAAAQPWIDVELSATVAGDGAPADVIVDQFDVQPLDQVVRGFGRGWYRDEYDPATGRLWRWSSGSAAVRILAQQAVRLVVRADSPRVWSSPPTITLRAGDRELARADGRSAVSWDLTVPVEILRAAHGEVLLETSRTFVPSEHSRSSDHRRLGLQVWQFDARPWIQSAAGDHAQTD